MIRYLAFGLLFSFCGDLALAPPVESCSTIMLSRDDCLVVGHNLDQEFYTPGMIHVNPRMEKKRSVSRFDLGMNETQPPILEWTSKYGSVTFSLLGRNLPDGGINEAGLTVSEMGLGESRFPSNDSLPAMLSHLWIQFQLDNYATVEEVIAHLPEINIEPSSTFSPPASANYHLFVTDSTSSLAIIEFLEDGLKVYTGETAPVPVLCNTPYEQELTRLEDYRGFFGWIKRSLNTRDDLRFVTGALALEGYESGISGDPAEYCMDVLTQMQFESTKQWSVVYDVPARRVYYRTTAGPNIRHFDLDSLDFSEDAKCMVIEDIDSNLVGDVSSQFVEFTLEADRATIDKFLRSLMRFCAKTENSDTMNAYWVENYAFDVNQYVDRALGISELIRNEKIDSTKP